MVYSEARPAQIASGFACNLLFTFVAAIFYAGPNFNFRTKFFGTKK